MLRTPSGGTTLQPWTGGGAAANSLQRLPAVVEPTLQSLTQKHRRNRGSSGRGQPRQPRRREEGTSSCPGAKKTSVTTATLTDTVTPEQRGKTKAASSLHPVF